MLLRLTVKTHIAKNFQNSRFAATTCHVVQGLACLRGVQPTRPSWALALSVQRRPPLIRAEQPDIRVADELLRWWHMALAFASCMATCHAALSLNAMAALAGRAPTGPCIRRIQRRHITITQLRDRSAPSKARLSCGLSSDCSKLSLFQPENCTCRDCASNASAALVRSQ